MTTAFLTFALTLVTLYFALLVLMAWGERKGCPFCRGLLNGSDIFRLWRR